MKGKWCPYRACLFCQEGCCKECHIYPVEVIGPDGYAKQTPLTCDVVGTEGVKCKRVL